MSTCVCNSTLDMCVCFFYYSHEHKSCRIVLFTACRTSLIFQQYNKGFNEELR